MLTRSILKSIALALGITLLAISLISFPQETLEASIRGLNMWWEVVFPSLLPFFIVSELLIGYGVVRFIGVLLEPLMRPLFRVPGVGGFVWAMGMASGFPAGAKITARLRQERQLTRVEAERLVSFTNASNPLFIFGAIAVGFFHNANLGIILALAHYFGNFLVGVIMRFYKVHDKEESSIHKNKFSIKEAFKAMHYTRMSENRPFGKMLGDAVTSSVQTLLMIGGFIILFSVFNKILFLINITETLALVFQIILAFFYISSDLAVPLISGLFEITLGSQLTSQADSSLLQQVIITSFILGFSGLSVQAQVASILAETDIRFKPFFVGRIMQGFFSALFALLLWKPLYVNLHTFRRNEIPVYQSEFEPSWIHHLWDFITNNGPFITITSLAIYVIFYSYRLKSKQS